MDALRSHREGANPAAIRGPADGRQTDQQFSSSGAVAVYRNYYWRFSATADRHTSHCRRSRQGHGLRCRGRFLFRPGRTFGCEISRLPFWCRRSARHRRSVLVIAGVVHMLWKANFDSILAMALTIGAVGGLLLYLRFGFVYTGVIAIACAAMIPFPLVHPVVGRHLLAAAILLVTFVLVRGNDLFRAAALAGSYVVLNLHISPDAVTDRGGFYWTTYVMVWLLPVVGLSLSLRARDRLLMDVSGAMLIATLATNKLYLGLPQQTWDPILFGLFLMIAAVWIRRWLAGGPNGTRFGFTAARVLNRDSRLMTVVSTASAAFQPHVSPSAPAVTETAKPQFAGGRSGGAGASGEF